MAVACWEDGRETGHRGSLRRSALHLLERRNTTSPSTKMACIFAKRANTYTPEESRPHPPAEDHGLREALGLVLKRLLLSPPALLSLSPSEGNCKKKKKESNWQIKDNARGKI